MCLQLTVGETVYFRQPRICFDAGRTWQQAPMTPFRNVVIKGRRSLHVWQSHETRSCSSPLLSLNGWQVYQHYRCRVPHGAVRSGNSQRRGSKSSARIVLSADQIRAGTLMRRSTRRRRGQASRRTATVCGVWCRDSRLLIELCKARHDREVQSLLSQDQIALSAEPTRHRSGPRSSAQMVRGTAEAISWEIDMAGIQGKRRYQAAEVRWQAWR